ncbi:dihydrolipoamide acetyltransferase family protein [Arthrobacter sp. UM1]|uniref:dihydrolipoamide acetyltransferase family protein n=1 Tax=Arthrobacter sp. UM1 TaxID=2766776 RepID=UPI001CF7177D|nr:dihydrolipoamide acetyltransferase family protein [Arthrobacter sp. UM1]MCB4209099.1 2-oxo acid dehydrogenase subunit E2 [Arthrobacter sp. UM1]
MSAQIFKLPDVGEGLTEAEITSWKVAEGDAVELNQVVLEIETAKSLVELPCPFEGTLTRQLVSEGETVSVGTPIYEVSGEGDDDASDGQAPQEGAPRLKAGESSDEAMKPLVGTGPKAESSGRRRRRAPQGGQAAGSPGTGAQAAPEAEAPQGERPAPVQDIVNTAAYPPAGDAPESPSDADLGGRPLAKPPVRKAAKDAGVDLAEVAASGQHGEVTRKDLEEYLAGRGAQGAGSGNGAGSGSAGGAGASGAGGQGAQPAAARGFSGETERIQVKGVRKMTAQAMVSSAFSAPHVSIFKEVDASATMELVQKLKQRKDYEGVRVSPLLVVAKAVIYAIERNPNVNAAWTDEEIFVKHFVNLGIAAATPRGLVVPNIKNAHALSLRELAVAIGDLTATARDGKTQPAEMQNGTFTITNVGSLGVDTGTPIINPGEVGILAFGSIRKKPWVVEDEIVPRWVTTVGGSFDHRLVDGDLAARFVSDVASVLEDPMVLLG